MIYSHIIFQIKIDNKKYLGYINYNEYNYYYISFNSENKNNKNNKIEVIKTIIKNYILALDNNLFNDIPYKISLISKYYDSKTIDDLIEDDITYDIFIDNKNKFIKIDDIEFEYEKVYDKIKNDVWNGDIYDTDEIEIMNKMRQLYVELECPSDSESDSESDDESDNKNKNKNKNIIKCNYGDDYGISENVYDIKDVEDIDEYEEYDYKEIEWIIQKNILYKNNSDILIKFIEGEYTKNKLADINNKLKILKYFHGRTENDDINNEIILTHTSLLCQKFKYLNLKNFVNIKHNFIVSKFSMKKYLYSPQKVMYFCVNSINDENIKGYYERQEYYDRKGHYEGEKIDYQLDDVNCKYKDKFFEYIDNNCIVNDND